MWQTNRIWISLLAHVLLNVTAGDAEIVWISLLVSVAVLTEGVVLLNMVKEHEE